MKIKLIEPAAWAGSKHRKGSIHDVDLKIAEKLIARGYAEEHIEPAVEEAQDDAPAAE